MVTFFIFCAVAGGTILVCQLVLTLVGLGGDPADLGGADAGHDGSDFHAGHDGDSPEGHDAHGHHGSTWLFGVISFRTLVAATTFFGLGGMVAESLGQPSLAQVVVALACGAAAMYTVHGILRLFARLAEDNTVRIRRAVGANATVYLTIPANRSGTGKVHVNVQGRLLEYPAITPNEEKLTTGAKVVVIGVVGTDTLEVEPLRESVAVA
jgi:hypothetical protein